MSTYRRNVAVGLTVLAALVTLGWMILRFGNAIATPFAAESLKIRFVTSQADGVSDGSAVLFRGVPVGHVTRVTRDPNMHDIWADAEVDAKPPLPNITHASIKTASALGSGSNLYLEPGPDDAPKLKDGDTIRATYVGLDLLPAEFKTLGAEVAATAKQLRDADFVGNLNARVGQAGKMMEAAQTTLDGMNRLVNDPKLRDDVTASIASIRQAADNAKAVTGRADAIAKNLDSAVATVNDTTKTAQAKIESITASVQQRLDQASAMLEQVNQITGKINQGQGTAGKLVNDPKLYSGLVDTTSELAATVKDLRRLVQQWEQEGVSLKLR